MTDAARRIIAVFLSFVLFSIIVTLGWCFPEASLYPFLLLMLSHVVAATVLGYMWPHIGWRIGLWMFVPWPVLLLVGFGLITGYFFSGNVAWKDVSVVLVFVFSILLIGCGGGWLGAVLAKRRRVHTNGI